MFSADQGVTPSSTLYVDDVFSTYLYTGNGSTQTITNGIDLAGKGGLLWLKARSQSYTNVVFDTARGMNTGGSNQALHPETTSPQDNYGANGEALSNGFSVVSSTPTNQNGTSYVSWTFRKAPKFFDVVTYTGNGTNQSISHSLGVAPGLIICKAISTSGNWFVYNNALGNQVRLYLNSTAIWDYWSYWNDTTPTSTTFSIGPVGANDSGVSYVAYLFAHDTTSTGLIRCGSFTTDASGNASVTSLGWEPQFLMAKAVSTTGDWIMLDTMRGWNMTSADALLRANLTNAETASTEYGNPTATGFDFKGGAASATYVYMAIRRPNKPPTSSSEVFSGNLFTNAFPAGLGGGAFARSYDLIVGKSRSGSGSKFADRLRGLGVQAASTSSVELDSTTTATEVGASNIRQYTWEGGSFNTFTDPVAWIFKRAPGFFDIVCYTGTGSATAVAHSLGVIPEFAIIKARNYTGAWWVGANPAGLASWQNSYLGNLNTTDALFTSTAIFNPGSATTVTPGQSDLYLTTVTYVMYLFASLPGISKIGTYTGNGTTQTINCGFAAGARFVLIKRTDAAGDWYVWDTARGIVAANDPHLSLNSTAAEVTTNDSVDPVSSGFAVNQDTATNINVSSATYLYFAVS